MEQTKIWSALAIGLIIGGVGAALVTYQITKEKWFALGIDAGNVAGRAEVMQAFCEMGTTQRPVLKADYVLDVKAHRLQAVRQQDGLQIFCE